MEQSQPTRLSHISAA